MPNTTRKEDGPQYYNERNQKIWEAVDIYFAQAGPDSDTNMRLIRPSIEKFGGIISLAGIAWVAEQLEHEGFKTARAAQMGVPGAILTNNIITIAKNSMNQLRDIVIVDDGNQAGTKLVTAIETATDEDESAIAAYMLANDFASGMPFMNKEASRFSLEWLLKNTEGTSCRMAISWAIYNMGNKKPWEEMVYGNYFVQKGWVEILEKTIKEVNPDFKKEEIKDIICREYAVPGSTNFPTPFVMDKMGILEILAIDIASNGQIFFRAYPNWTRKAKKVSSP